MLSTLNAGRGCEALGQRHATRMWMSASLTKWEARRLNNCKMIYFNTNKHKVRIIKQLDEDTDIKCFPVVHIVMENCFDNSNEQISPLHLKINNCKNIITFIAHILFIWWPSMLIKLFTLAQLCLKQWSKLMLWWVAMPKWPNMKYGYVVTKWHSSEKNGIWVKIFCIFYVPRPKMWRLALNSCCVSTCVIVHMSLPCNCAFYFLLMADTTTL